MPVTLPSGPIIHFDTTAQRTAHSASALSEGQLCYVQDADAHYRWDGSAWVIFGAVGSGPFSIGALLLGAPPTNGFYMVWRAPFACTVVAVRSHFDAGTNIVVNARVNQTSNFMSSDFTNSTANAWGAGTVNQNTAIALGDDIEVTLVSTSGAVTKANIQVDLVRA
jgi:hypothetical protein